MAFGILSYGKAECPEQPSEKQWVRAGALLTRGLLQDSEEDSGFFFFLILFISIGGLLLYNIVMIFAIYQYESVIGIHVSPPS